MDQMTEDKIRLLNRQGRRVAEYMREFGRITPLEAFRDLGVTRLAARIHEMRQAGIDVMSNTIEATNRFQEPVHYSCYWLPR